MVTMIKIDHDDDGCHSDGGNQLGDGHKHDDTVHYDGDGHNDD